MSLQILGNENYILRTVDTSQMLNGKLTLNCKDHRECKIKNRQNFFVVFLIFLYSGILEILFEILMFCQFYFKLAS